MPSTTFVDTEIIEELNKINSKSEETIFPEHDFYLACLRLGLRIDDMKYLSYIDILKMFICLNKTNTKKTDNIKSATQKDIDRLLG